MVTKKQTHEMTPSEMIARAKELIAQSDWMMGGAEQFRQDHLFMSDHMDEWREQYVDHFVAVYKGELVAVSPTSEGLFRELTAKRVPLGSVALDYVRAKNVYLVV